MLRAAPAIFGAIALSYACAGTPLQAQSPPLPAPAHTPWAEAEDVTPPPPPAPHARRASSERHAFHARLMQSWRASRSSPQQPTTGKAVQSPLDAQLPPPRQAKIETDAEATAQAWTTDEIKRAEIECDEMLASIDAVAERRPPLREGTCGTPVPLRVSRIGSRKGIVIEPPAIMNCKMAARLYQWIETVVEPAARTALGAGIVRIRNASSYMCRNRYNDPAEKMSQHAYANAIDMSEFELADGRQIDVKTFWGSIVASRLAAESTTLPPTQANLKARALTTGLDQNKAAGKTPVEPASGRTSTRSLKTPELQFLTGLHTGACGIFSTVLGPETNRAHHDHMHLDLTPRRGSAYCQ